MYFTKQLLAKPVTLGLFYYAHFLTFYFMLNFRHSLNLFQQSIAYFHYVKALFVSVRTFYVKLCQPMKKLTNSIQNIILMSLTNEIYSKDMCIIQRGFQMIGLASICVSILKTRIYYELNKCVLKIPHWPSKWTSPIRNGWENKCQFIHCFQGFLGHSWCKWKSALIKS